MMSPDTLDCKIDGIRVSAYSIPTATPEADGTYEWNSTTLVLVEATAGGKTGLGYTYAHKSTASLIETELAPIVVEMSALDIPAAWTAMLRQIRNNGRPGICSMAISAVDTALWDLKARLLGVSLSSLFGRDQEDIEIYGSGGFTNYSDKQLLDQLTAWAGDGIKRLKMKVGRDANADIARVHKARDAIGDDVDLFVDANGAYGRKQALYMAHVFAQYDVTWFEEPRSSEDLEGLRFLRDQSPANMDITAGEYGYHQQYFRRMMEAQAVDVMQADVSRCGGFTGWLQVSALCEAFEIPLSAHCVPQLTTHVCCATRPLRHIEYFFDHARIEKMLFDGTLEPKQGRLRPDTEKPGNGLTFKYKDAEEFRISF